ncbi:MAG: hypothetical protein IPM76_23070 [Chloroflexi bacterium]|nr:hypothetical protein [Chloroflexota bacterium]
MYVAHDAGEQIVEIMGNAAGQVAQFLHFLALSFDTPGPESKLFCACRGWFEKEPLVAFGVVINDIPLTTIGI